MKSTLHTLYKVFFFNRRGINHSAMALFFCDLDHRHHRHHQWSGWGSVSSSPSNRGARWALAKHSETLRPQWLQSCFWIQRTSWGAKVLGGMATRCGEKAKKKHNTGATQKESRAV